MKLKMYFLCVVRKLLFNLIRFSGLDFFFQAKLFLNIINKNIALII